MRINRDTEGGSIFKYKVLTWVLVGLVVITLAFVGVASIVKSIADWGAEHQWVRQRAFDVSIQWPYRVEDVGPVEVLSPLAVEVTGVEIPEDLTETEQKILDAWGERYFIIMRALAVCESGMNPLAVNWGSKDIGLFQINLPTWDQKVREKFGYTIADLFDTDKNIEVAYWIWDRADGKEGDGKGDISPWVASGTACFDSEL